ncbi:MAG: hypothetical protein PHX13_12245 [Thiovulaceae bacterium]|nr:hypothetical protein [Sulfurimonadaceae bacterium]
MTDYVENGYVEEGYVEGGSTAPVTCDLSLVNTKLDLILTKLSSMSTRLDVLESNISAKVQAISFDSLNADLLADYNGVITALGSVGSLDLSPLTIDLVRIETKLDDVRTNVNEKMLTTENVKQFIPMVDDLSLRIYPVGTKVNVIGVDGVGTIVSSALNPTTDFLFQVLYTVKSSDGRFGYFLSDLVNILLEP